jgi:hypothetical protein
LEKKEVQIGVLAASVLLSLFLFIWIAYRLDLDNDVLDDAAVRQLGGIRLSAGDIT